MSTKKIFCIICLMITSLELFTCLVIKTTMWLTGEFLFDVSWWYTVLAVPIVIFVAGLFDKLPQATVMSEAEQARADKADMFRQDLSGANSENSRDYLRQLNQQIVEEGFEQDVYGSREAGDSGLLVLASIIGLIASWYYIAWLIKTLS